MKLARSIKIVSREYVLPLAVAVAIVFPLRSSLADWYDVPTGSMKPTIMEGDRIVAIKAAYDLKVPFTTRHIAKWADPELGHIVIVYSPHDGKRLVKRIGAVPGDSFGGSVVPQGKYAILGDNTEHSFDSRYFGLVDRRQIVGRAVGVAFSRDMENWHLPRKERWCRKLN